MALIKQEVDFGKLFGVGFGGNVVGAGTQLYARSRKIHYFGF